MQPKGNKLGSNIDLNNEAYLKMKNGLSKFKGKYVVFANGKFIGAFTSIENVGRTLRSLRPRPKHVIVFKVGHDARVKGSPEWWGGSIELESA